MDQHDYYVRSPKESVSPLYGLLYMLAESGSSLYIKHCHQSDPGFLNVRLSTNRPLHGLNH